MTEKVLSRDFVVVNAVSIISISGFSATLPLVPRYVEEELGRGKVAVGFAIGIFSLSALLVRPVIGYLGDTRGRRVLLVGGCMLSGVAIGAHAVATTLTALLAVRLAMGATQAGFFVGSTTIVTDIAPPDRRGQATSWFGVAIYGGQAIGPIVGELVEERYGFATAFIVAGGLMMAGGVLARALPAFVPEPADAANATEGSARAGSDAAAPPRWRRYAHPAALPPGSVLALGIVSFVAFTAFMPLYVSERGLGRSAPVFAVYAITVLVLRLVGASIPDDFGTVPTATAALVGVTGGMAIMWLWPSILGLYLGTVISAAGGSLLFPTLLVAAVQGVEPSERTAATSTFTAFFEMSAGIGGPILGVAAAWADTARAAFGVAAGFALIGLLVLHLRLAHSSQIVIGTGRSR